MNTSQIPEKAVEVAARVMHAQESTRQGMGEFSLEVYEHDARAILTAAARYMRAEAEQELSQARRVVALLVNDAGGEIAIGRRAVTELPDETFIETETDAATGGWVIRTKLPRG